MDSQGDDEAAKIELTYSIPSHINRAPPRLRMLVVCIIQVNNDQVQFYQVKAASQKVPLREFGGG